MDQPVIKYAEETGDFRTRLNRYDDELYYLFTTFQSNMLHGHYDDEIVNQTISVEVTIMRLLLPKIEGGGKKTEHLLKEFEEFRPWLNNICIPKTNPDESEKIPKLYDLIQKTNHYLNISNL